MCFKARLKWSCFEGVIFGFLRGCVFFGGSCVFVRGSCFCAGSCAFGSVVCICKGVCRMVRVFGTYGYVLTSSQHYTGVRNIVQEVMAAMITEL